MSKPPTIVPLTLGPMPVLEIYSATGHELDVGPVVLSINAQKHAAKRHPDDYSKYLLHVANVVTQPLFIGDDFKNHGKIELISKVLVLGSGLLIAVKIEPDKSGNYHVSSFYPISEKKISGRLDKGFLKRTLQLSTETKKGPPKGP